MKSKATPAEIGSRVARKMFDIRGNNSEIHISEVSLALIVESAIELYVRVTEAK